MMCPPVTSFLPPSLPIHVLGRMGLDVSRGPRLREENLEKQVA